MIVFESRVHSTFWHYKNCKNRFYSPRKQSGKKVCAKKNRHNISGSSTARIFSKIHNSFQCPSVETSRTRSARKIYRNYAMYKLNRMAINKVSCTRTRESPARIRDCIKNLVLKTQIAAISNFCTNCTTIIGFHGKFSNSLLSRDISHHIRVSSSVAHFLFILRIRTSADCADSLLAFQVKLKILSVFCELVSISMELCRCLNLSFIFNINLWMNFRMNSQWAGQSYSMMIDRSLFCFVISDFTFVLLQRRCEVLINVQCIFTDKQLRCEQ